MCGAVAESIGKPSDDAAERFAKTGRLLAIARRAARYAPMEEISSGTISLDGGLEGDHKGPKFPKRRITIMSVEAWRAVLAELAGEDAFVDLPWTVRRANLLVEGVRLPRARGGIVRIGGAEFEIWYPTQPCARMDKSHPGLLRALHPDWRGGVCCAVRRGAHIAVGDPVEILHAPPEAPRRRLPG